MNREVAKPNLTVKVGKQAKKKKKKKKVELKLEKISNITRFQGSLKFFTFL